MERRNIGIFAHVDAGKTTLSEQLLLRGGRLQKAGSVDHGTAYTDSLPVEKRRGISVRAMCTSFHWQDTEICLIDTPGHADFSMEIERSMWAMDGAVLVLSAVEGVQPQTEILFAAMQKRHMPVLFFLNKTDRENADVERTLAQIRRRLTGSVFMPGDADSSLDLLCTLDDAWMEAFLSGRDLPASEVQDALASYARKGLAFPVLSGSALTGLGVDTLMDAMPVFLPPPASGPDLSGIVFGVHRDRTLGRGCWVRLFGGELKNRDALQLPGKPDPLTFAPTVVEQKITQIRSLDGHDMGTLHAGEIGVIYGLGPVRVGQVLGDESLLPGHEPGQLRQSILKMKVVPDREEDWKRLEGACQELALEDPLLDVEFIPELKEISLHLMGMIQTEILQEELLERFQLPVTFRDPTVIYKETVVQPGLGFVSYTMPKPCWAILQFYIRPGKRGSGVQYHSEVPVRKIQERYQHQVEQALPIALSQGRMGWEVTDVDITLVDGSDHQFHTHPLDFILATPMGIQDGLRNCGTCLLEPILRIRFLVPLECAGRVMSDIQIMRGQVLDSQSEDDRTEIVARVPAAECYRYMDELASLTGGRGSMSQTLDGYELCPPGKGSTTPRRGVDPLDTAKYILSIRNAIQG